MLHTIAGLILAAIIIWGGAVAARHVVIGAGAAMAARMPAPARARAATAGKRAARHVVEPVRHIRARAMADVRATHWLERKRSARVRRETRRTERRQARPDGTPRRIHMPRVAIHVPGVTDQQPSKPVLAVVPAVPAQPAKTTSPVQQPAPGRQPAMSTPRMSVTPHHAAVNAYVASFEPESDGDLIKFMSGEAAGMAGYAHSFEQLSEHLLNSVGLDPSAVQGMTEFAQAVTEAAAIMTRANGKFQQTYQGVRETVAGGTVLPFSGRWINGESA